MIHLTALLQLISHSISVHVLINASLLLRENGCLAGGPDQVIHLLPYMCFLMTRALGDKGSPLHVVPLIHSGCYKLPQGSPAPRSSCNLPTLYRVPKKLIMVDLLC
jgi:hypothetical protein